MLHKVKKFICSTTTTGITGETLFKYSALDKHACFEIFQNSQIDLGLSRNCEELFHNLNLCVVNNV